MSVRLRYLSLLLLVASLALLSTWLLKSVEQQFRQPSEPASFTPDYFLDNFTATVMNAAGTPEYILSAERLEHYPVDEWMQVRAPFMKVFRDGDSTWSLTAQRGEVYQKGETVYLMDNVTLKHDMVGEREPVTLLTQMLHVDTTNKTAHTYAPVKITQADSIIEATGIRVDMIDGTIELLADTRGYYEPPS